MVKALWASSLEMVIVKLALSAVGSTMIFGANCELECLHQTKNQLFYDGICRIFWKS